MASASAADVAIRVDAKHSASTSRARGTGASAPPRAGARDGAADDSLTLFSGANRPKVTPATVRAAHAAGASDVVSYAAATSPSRARSAIVNHDDEEAETAPATAAAPGKPLIDDDDDDPILTRRTVCQVVGAYALLVLWFVVAFCAVIMFWVGVWKVCDKYTFPPVWWAEWVWITLGLLFLIVTANFDNVIGRGNNSVSVSAAAASASVNGPTDLNPAPPPESPFTEVARTGVTPSRCRVCAFISGLYVRATFGLLGIILVWKGAWTTFDLYVSRTSVVREGVYIAVGWVLLVLSDTLLSQGGVNLASYMRDATAITAQNKAAGVGGRNGRSTGGDFSSAQSPPRATTTAAAKPKASRANPPPPAAPHVTDEAVDALSAALDSADATTGGSGGRAGGVPFDDSVFDSADRVVVSSFRRDSEEPRPHPMRPSAHGIPPLPARDDSDDDDDAADEEAERARLGLLGTEVGWAPTVLTGSTAGAPVGVIDMFLQHNARVKRHHQQQQAVQQQRALAAGAAAAVTAKR